MATIGDKIREWADKNIRGSSALTGSTEAYNQMVQAEQELLAQPWALIVIQPDMSATVPEGAIVGDEKVKKL